MTVTPCWQTIPTKLNLEQFEQCVVPHLRGARRGPPPTLSLHKISNYIWQLLYMGCQWKMLPIERNAKGLPEIHYTRIYRAMRRWLANGSIDRIFAGSVDKLHQDRRLDLTVIHGDGTTTATKKGGDNLGYSGKSQLWRGLSWVRLRPRPARARRHHFRSSHFGQLPALPGCDHEQGGRAIRP